MRIGIDIDDTILGFYKEFSEFSNINHGTDLDELDLGKDFFGAFGSKEKTILILKDFVDRGLTTSLKIFEDFKKNFEELKNFNFFFITSRSYDQRDKTKDFLKNNLNYKNIKIYYTHDYEIPKKSFLCKKINIGILIEDDPRNAVECADNNIRVFLISKKWNREVEHKNIIRVNNWNEILEKIKEIENE